MEGELLGKKQLSPRNGRRWCRCSTTTVTLLLFLVTNTASILLSSGAGASVVRRYEPATVRLWDDSAALLADLNATRSALESSRVELAGLHARLGTATALLQTLLAEAARGGDGQRKEEAPASGNGWWARELVGELKLAVGNASDGEAALGHACGRFQDELERYMDYKPGGECPSDAALEHLLMRGGCEPLPRRRCRPQSPPGYAEPAPLPKSLWSMPPDTSVVWDAYHPCRNYSCMASRGLGLDLRGRREKGLWTRDDGALAYSVDTALAAKPKGTVRIGLDIGGGGGTFAARMRERGVTVVTATTNAGAPFGSFVASRGLVPLHVGQARRLPFFDGTLDVVHAGRELTSDWMVPGDGVAMEFALFDVYRVLRPGGLFWLDHFVFPGAQLNATYAPMLHRVGFKRLRWNAGRKPDGGVEKNEWYLSALLQKPMT
ncbi:hypothetical protein CFC21_098244 [Triticum aestivum]|uniref:Methyltransferase type 11 domain-containing protein n=2 Tax=Triticum aestivum TaxID=4565 RepID=A0A3B6RH91_WHEAT|nr:probable methyltransferase At1g29790 [Triticum aestivum]KAF7096273.1 hypothetical protein CFC21_098244 [Triticum aestivum]